MLMGRGGSRRQLLLALVAACLAGSGLGATVQRELEDLGAPKRYGRGGWQPLWDPSQVPSHPPEWKEFHQSPLNPDGGEVRASICISVHLCKAAAACSLHAYNSVPAWAVRGWELDDRRLLAGPDAR